MRLVLHRLWVDDDEMLQVEVSLQGSGYAATQDVYVYPADLEKFGHRLEAFPASASDEAMLEIGSADEKAYCWLKLRAYVYDGRGHSALELCVKRNGAPHVCAQAQFSVQIEAASLNSLGAQITKWAASNENPLVFERSDG